MKKQKNKNLPIYGGDHIQRTGPNIYSSNKLKYCWVRVPKCGGSTITHYLQKHARPTHHEWAGSHSGWQDYFKFAFVRNPWDRLYSCYNNKVLMGDVNCSKYLQAFAKTKPSFRDWIKEISREDNILKDRHFSPFHTLLINKDFKSMDFMGKIENFKEDFNFVCDKIGISREKLPHKNKTKHKHYTEYYDEETKQIVAEKYAKDIEYFGYKFGE